MDDEASVVSHRESPSPTESSADDNEISRRASPGTTTIPKDADPSLAEWFNVDRASTAPDKQIDQGDDSETDPDSDYDEAFEGGDASDWFSVAKGRAQGDRQDEPEVLVLFFGRW